MIVSPEGGSGELSRGAVQGRVPRSAQSPAITVTSCENSGSLRSSPRRRTGKAEGGTADVGEGVADGVEMLCTKMLIVTCRPPTHKTCSRKK